MEIFPCKVSMNLLIINHSPAMLSHTFYNSHSQVNDPWPEGPLVVFFVCVDAYIPANNFLVMQGIPRLYTTSGKS